MPRRGGSGGEGPGDWHLAWLPKRQGVGREWPVTARGLTASWLLWPWPWALPGASPASALHVPCLAQQGSELRPRRQPGRGGISRSRRWRSRWISSSRPRDCAGSRDGSGSWRGLPGGQAGSMVPGTGGALPCPLPSGLQAWGGLQSSGWGPSWRELGESGRKDTEIHLPSPPGRPDQGASRWPQEVRQSPREVPPPSPRAEASDQAGARSPLRFRGLLVLGPLLASPPGRRLGPRGDSHCW